MELPNSTKLLERAAQVIPGGVNSPVRAFKSVEGTPPFIDRAEGPYIYDVEGNRYIDFVNSWGPMILGHAPEGVISALQKIISKGTSFGAPTELEIVLAEMIVERVPSADMVRLVNSGTEATMSAVRVARGATGRNKFIKFDGCYHGHGDSFLIAAGSGAMTLGIPNSPGVTAANAADTLLAQFNDIESVSSLFKEHPEDIAGIIVEPVAGNMGCVPPLDNFLGKLRELCDQYGALLILDEVMTGFRVARGGANELYQVEADLLCFGKVIGGGLPIGAYGGKRKYMEQVAPSGPIYQAGTLSGNPVAVTAGIETLKQLTPEVYTQLEELGQHWQEEVQKVIDKNNYPLTQHRVGSMVSLFFTSQAIRSFADVTTCDIDKFNRFFHLMLEKGVYLAPSQYEVGFLSTVQNKEMLSEVIAKMEESLAEVFAG